MALDRSPYRHAFIDRPEQLRRAGVSVLAERLYSELERGRWSNMAGLCWWHVDLVRVSLREHSRAKVDAALDELERAGFVSVNRQVSAVLLPHEAQAAAECGPHHRQGMAKICQTFPSCSQVDLVLEIIENADKGYPRATQGLPKTSGVRNRSKEQEQDQEQDLSVATAPAPVKPSPAKKPTCIQEALDMMLTWNTICTDLPKVRVQEGALCDDVAKAWRKEPDLELWCERFRKVQASDWHSGRDGKWRGGSLKWAITSGRSLMDARRDDGGNTKTARKPNILDAYMTEEEQKAHDDLLW